MISKKIVITLSDETVQITLNADEERENRVMTLKEYYDQYDYRPKNSHRLL